MTLTVFSGDDPDPMSHVVGSYFISLDTNTGVTQVIRNLVAGSVYSLNIVAVSSTGFTVELYALIPCEAVYY